MASPRSITTSRPASWCSSTPPQAESFRPGSRTPTGTSRYSRSPNAAVIAIGLWSMIYGIVQVVLSFEIKSLPERADNAARTLDNVTAPRRFDAAV
jgi:hypothetical protein